MMLDPDLERAAASVMRAVEFVEERKAEDIGAQDMAAAACYSAFYFSRLFARATGHAPYDYLMRRRVAAAAERVASGDGSITDIALDCGFDVPDTFAQAFRRCFGCLPSEARKEGSYPRAIARTKIGMAYIERMLADGLPIAESEDAQDMLVEGEWECADEAEVLRVIAEGSVMVVERDECLRPLRMLVGARLEAAGVSGRGMPAGRRAPAFPRSASLIEGGPRARFRVEGFGPLARTVEFAYRAWLPQAGYPAAPAFDLVEAGPGGSLSLVLPLGAAM